MFSENQKISSRQTTRLLIYDMIGISSLLLPPILAKEVGGDGISCIFLALIPAYLFLEVVRRLQKRAGGDYLVYLRNSWGKIISSVLLVFYYLYHLLLAGFALYFLSRLVKMQLLKEEPYTLICICILLLGGYGILGGIEGKARIYEILFWFLMLPLLFMLVLAAKDVNTDYWTPVLVGGWRSILEGTIIVFAFYMLIYFVLFLHPYEKEPEQGIRCAKKALGVSAVVNAAIYLITLGIFGRKALAAMDYPVVTLMSMIKIPGGFFQRQDAFMVAIWFFALYALINSGMFYGTECLKALIRRKGKKRYVAATLLLTFGAAYCFYISADMQARYEICFLGVTLLLFLLVPLLLMLRKRWKSAVATLLVLMLSSQVSGCSSVELEKRNFPLAVALDKDSQGYSMELGFQDLSELSDEDSKKSDKTETTPVKEASWYEAFSTVATSQPGTMDYNHVKVLILGSELLDDKEALMEFLNYVEKEEIFSRNTLLYASDKPSDVLATDENLELPVGTYLEQIADAQENLGNRGVVTLGSLLNEMQNRQENLYIPMLEEPDGKPVVSQYYALSSFSSIGALDEDTFLTAMLLENKLDKYHVRLDTGEAVELSEIGITYKMEKEGKQCLEKIEIKAEARLKSGDLTEGQDELEQRIQEYLELQTAATANHMLQEKGIDISNSYYRLGGYNREIYEKYKDNQKGYLKKLKYEINYKIQLIVRE